MEKVGSTGPLLVEEPPDTESVMRRYSGRLAGTSAKAPMFQGLVSRGTDDAPQVPVEVTAAYHGYCVSQPKLGAPNKHEELRVWKGEYGTQVLRLDDSDDGRRARALSGGKHAEEVILEWEQERPKPFWKSDGPVTWERSLTDEFPAGGMSRKKHWKPVVAQMQPVRWVHEAVECARRIPGVQDGFIVGALGVPETAHCPQRFHRKRRFFFVDRAAANVRLCESLPLTVLTPPWKTPRELLLGENKKDEKDQTWAEGKSWKELFRDGVLRTNLEPFLRNSEKYDANRSLAENALQNVTCGDDEEMKFAGAGPARSCSAGTAHRMRQEAGRKNGDARLKW